MTLVSQSSLIENGINESVRHIEGKHLGNNIFTPAPDAIASAPKPSTESPVQEIFRPALCSSSDGHDPFADFVALGVKRRINGECFVDLPHQQIAEWILETAGHGVSDSLKNKMSVRVRLSDVSRAQKILW